jgi:hypothetical protein
MGADLNLSAFCGDENDPQAPPRWIWLREILLKERLLHVPRSVSQPMRRTKHGLYDSIVLRREVQRFASVGRNSRCANIENGRIGI